MTSIGLMLIPQDANDLSEESGELREMLEITADFYRRAGYCPPWTSYLAVAVDEVRSLATGFVGIGAFKSVPRDGRVEIAYATFEAQRGKGVATEIAKGLTSIARKHDPTVVVTARTLIERNASQRVLEKAGFRNAGVVVDPEDGEVLEWIYEDVRKEPSGNA